jgi:ABC-2 type transport system ATP-binding protein
MHAIEIQKVSKQFGRQKVLDNLDLAVPQGKTYAFLGRNGAGKTTTIRMLMGLIRPDAGEIRINGLNPRTDATAIRRTVGYLAEDQEMWGWMKICEILSFLAPFYPTWDWPLAQELMDKFALPANQKIRHLSKGQNVRLGLLLALAHKPNLVILDDPALGLDPIMRKEFLRDVVTHLQGRNITVFFSSHLLYEVEPVADIVGILDKGRLVCQEETETLRHQVKQIILDANKWKSLSGPLGEVTEVLNLRRDGTQVAVTLRDIQKAHPILAGEPLEEISLNLDEIFEAFVAGTTEKPPAPTSPSRVTQPA